MHVTSIRSCLLLLFFFAVSCSKKEDFKPIEAPSQPPTISALRRIQLSENLQLGTTAIKAVVISDAANGNIPPSTIIVQEEGKDAAMILETNGNAPTLPAGTEITLNIENAGLSMENGELKLTGLSPQQITATGRMADITPKTTNIATMALNAAYWGPILVKVEKVNLAGGEDGFLKGEISIEDGIDNAIASILGNASFSDEERPDFVEGLTGILRLADGRIFINPRNVEDIQVGLTEMLEDFEEATSTNYDVKTLPFRTGEWVIDGGITASTAADLKNGRQSIRLQGSTNNANRKGEVTMLFDVKGVKLIKLSHGIYPAAAEVNNVNPTTFDVEISKDGGNTYTLLQQVEVDTKAAELKTATIPVNAGLNENVRFRIVNSSTPFANNNKPRISLDDFFFEF